MAETALQSSVSAAVLICDPTGTPERLLEALRSHGHTITCAKSPQLVSGHLRCLLPDTNIVLFDVTTTSSGVLKTIEQLHAATAAFNVGPRLLCFSTAHRNPRFAMAIKKWGAQYVRVDGVEMLCEAVNLLSAEMKELERNRPCFEIIHRFSQGSCAPGEAIESAFLQSNEGSFQLPLGLAQRFLFDFFGQHRRVALDAQQIVSGVSGDWFYRDHAANSGYRQLKKIRRPAVKVLVQRIREAMATAFTQARLRLDPYDVLRSYPVEGSKRVQYKLVADVRWRHLPR